MCLEVDQNNKIVTFRVTSRRPDVLQQKWNLDHCCLLDQNDYLFPLNSEPILHCVKTVSCGAESQRKTLLSTLGNFHVKWAIMVLIPVCVSRNMDLLSPCEQTVTKPWLLRPCVLPFILALFQRSWRRRGRDVGHWLSVNRKSSSQTCSIIDCSCQTLIVLRIMEQRPLYTSLTYFMFFGEAQRALKQGAVLWELESLSSGEEKKTFFL